ncbi:MAG: NYN domain-containing protein [Oscillospiraceae bacterium]
MAQKRAVIGILAHVDAGKTTLAEAMLYTGGAIRTLGRVDHGDAFLDNFSLERERGITIFSKQAALTLPTLQATLLDTPGHVDFSAEMERTLDVLDCAVLVISAPAGVQSHTRTLWKLLRRRNIPTLLFLNKTDLPCPDRAGLLDLLRRELGDGFFGFERPDGEHLALCDEGLMEEYLETGALGEDSLTAAVARCRVFPCWFGAALKLEGVEEFLRGLERCAPAAPAGQEFGAKVFKISRDERGARLTHLKVTGGVLRTRDTITGDGWEEKITQLRVLSGGKFTPVEEALPGDVVAAVGLTHTSPGMGLGAQEDGPAPALEPVLTYRVFFEEGTDVHKAYLQLRQLEEEDPQLHLVWDERLRQLKVQLMGPVQREVLSQVIADRFGLTVTFGPGQVLYRETIQDTVEGVGHYEPLRHYAEVHLLLEPGEPGSGLRFASACPEDELDRNWQRLILTHLAEKQHLGVLTGSPITDMTITLTAGRAHEKHTEGGDFRQATYRAVRQGLMQARSVLLEPWYDFRLEVPQSNVGRAITDLQRMGAEFDAPETEGDFSVLTGSVSAAALGDYPRELAAYTRGLGRFSCTLRGYAPCADQEKVVQELGYDPESDVDNTPDSVFCSHGAGRTVKWREVFDHMHLPSTLNPPEEATVEERAARYFSQVASDAELMAIFERTYGPVKDKVKALRPAVKSRPAADKPFKGKPRPAGPEYLLVDGYNIIFAWEDLRALAQDSLDAARTRLIERLRNYQGWRQCPVIVVFDAYKVKGNPGSVEKLGGVSVVYTKEAETADMYIEKAAHDLSKNHRVRVATSDGLEQVIILGGGALRLPASAFEAEVKEAEDAIRTFLQR